jgi:hypothetical protein
MSKENVRIEDCSAIVIFDLLMEAPEILPYSPGEADEEHVTALKKKG